MTEKHKAQAKLAAIRAAIKQKEFQIKELEAELQTWQEKAAEAAANEE